MLTADGTLDPYGAATDHAQIAYQHARHVGLPVDAVSPIERQQRLRTPSDLSRRSTGADDPTW
jgi:hypothetical protein